MNIRIVEFQNQSAVERFMNTLNSDIAAVERMYTMPHLNQETREATYAEDPNKVHISAIINEPIAIVGITKLEKKGEEGYYYKVDFDQLSCEAGTFICQRFWSFMQGVRMSPQFEKILAGPPEYPLFCRVIEGEKSGKGSAPRLLDNWDPNDEILEDMYEEYQEARAALARDFPL